MPTWNSDQYLKFANERTQPSIDLVNRITLAAPRRIVDLGCGPGNSTAAVGRRWPNSEITGLDSSASMLAAARRDHPQWNWVESDIAEWAEGIASAPPAEHFDLVFSNAALQWVPQHDRLLPRLLRCVAEGGALAFQIPHSLGLPHHRRIRELAASPRWQQRFQPPPITWHVEPPEFYYDVLAPYATRTELWLTDYVHILADVDAIVEWYRGTGLRPFLDALSSDKEREDFLREYRDLLVPDYPRRADGRTLMPFRRLFVIAYR